MNEVLFAEKGKPKGPYDVPDYGPSELHTSEETEKGHLTDGTSTGISQGWTMGYYTV